MWNKDHTRLFDHDANVGLVRPKGLPRHGHHGREVERAEVETDRVLHVVQRNLESLTRQVPMVAV